MATEFVVRPAQDSDLASILGLRPEFRGSGAPTPKEVATWQRMMSTEDLSVYVATVTEEIVGTVTTMQMPNVTYDCAPTLFVEAVLVAAPFRRRGIATEMMRRALEDATQSGCNKVQLLSHKRHATDGAHEMYKRLGFQAEAEGFRLYLRQ
jgi:ribosomal protein S18 acetylase RimI-like enzyme